MVSESSDTPTGGLTLSEIVAAADTDFRLREVFVFPNPAKRRNPTFHVAVGVADSVDLRIYDVAGDLRHSASLRGPPKVVDRGAGPILAYEYDWNVSGVGSDVYIYVVVAKKAGFDDIKVIKKVAVIK